MRRLAKPLDGVTCLQGSNPCLSAIFIGRSAKPLPPKTLRWPAANQEFTIEFPKLDLKKKQVMPVLEFQVEATGVGNDVFKYQYEWVPPKS